VIEIGQGVSLTKGQHATITCISKSQKWTYTLRKLLLMVYTDEFLGSHCAVGKKGSKNKAINFEELGALKGKLICLFFVQVYLLSTFNFKTIFFF